MPAWPSDLPQYVNEQGYSERLPDLTVEFPVDTGPPKVRRRFTTHWRQIAATMWMTRAQVETFRTFYLTTLKGGVDTFTWVNPITQAAGTFKFRGGAPQISDKDGDCVSVSFQLWQVA